MGTTPGASAASWIHALRLPEARGDPRVRAVIDGVLSWGQRQAW